MQPTRTEPQTHDSVQDMKQMKDDPFIRWKPRVTALLLALGMGVSGCKKEATAPPPPPVVQVMNVAATNAPMHTEIIGQLDSPQNVEVRARVEAFVEKILFTE